MENLALKNRPSSLKPDSIGRILIVEDDKSNALVVGMVLGLKGYSYDIVHSGEEALQAIQQRKYSIVLMDMILPGMDGAQATRHIRVYERQKRMAPLTILALTAQSHIECEHRFLKAGSDGFLCKPLQLEELEDRITTLANERRQAG